MENQSVFRFHKGYFAFTVLLFLVEVIIAFYVKDKFIRPYFGDFLVVILMYCFIRSFFTLSVWKTAFLVLILAYIVEVLQYVNLLGFLGLTQSKTAKILLGNSFSWDDMLAYTLGVVFVVFVEKFLVKKQKV